MPKLSAFAELAPQERDAIMHFTLLWSYFEGQALDNRASADEIVDLARRWEGQGRLDLPAFDKSFAYFKRRYFPRGTATVSSEISRISRSNSASSGPALSPKSSAALEISSVADLRGDARPEPPGDPDRGRFA